MSHSTALSMQRVMVDMTLLLTVMRHLRWSAVILRYLKPPLTQALNLRIVYAGLTALTQQQQGLWFCVHLVYTHRWSGVKIRTHFSTFWGSSSTMMDTLMSDPFRCSSLLGASISWIIFSTAYLMLITSSP